MSGRNGVAGSGVANKTSAPDALSLDPVDRFASLAAKAMPFAYLPVGSGGVVAVETATDTLVTTIPTASRVREHRIGRNE